MGASAWDFSYVIEIAPACSGFVRHISAHGGSLSVYTMLFLIYKKCSRDVKNNKNKKVKKVVDTRDYSLYYIRALIRNSGARNRNFGL